MQHRIFVVPPRPDLVAARVREHWERRHGEVFGRTPGLVAYRQNRPLDEEWATGGARLCSETWYDDRAAERAAYRSPHYLDVVAADEASFLVREAAWSAVVVQCPPQLPATEETRLLWFGARPPEGWDWQVWGLDRRVPAPGSGTSVHVAVLDDPAPALALTREAPVVALVCRSRPVTLPPAPHPAPRPGTTVRTDTDEEPA